MTFQLLTALGRSCELLLVAMMCGCWLWLIFAAASLAPSV